MHHGCCQLLEAGDGTGHGEIEGKPLRSTAQLAQHVLQLPAEGHVVLGEPGAVVARNLQRLAVHAERAVPAVPRSLGSALWRRWRVAGEEARGSHPKLLAGLRGVVVARDQLHLATWDHARQVLCDPIFGVLVPVHNLHGHPDGSKLLGAQTGLAALDPSHCALASAPGALGPGLRQRCWGEVALQEVGDSADVSLHCVPLIVARPLVRPVPVWVGAVVAHAADDETTQSDVEGEQAQSLDGAVAVGHASVTGQL
mmetsp:Transcript_31611/g.98571  ORF Transcript_31611/g.98571 Transcript_31611/m.98571 type:complete len:255 (-) Transcript_31611:36-800(-)